MSMSTEMDLWLEEQAALACPVPRRGPPALVALSNRDLEVVPPCPLSEAELDWLWSRYQRCSFPPATFAKRFARTARERLTSRGKNAAVRLAFKYRRQIFGASARKWAEDVFLSAVRVAAEQFRKGVAA